MLFTAVVCYYLSKWICTSCLKATFTSTGPKQDGGSDVQSLPCTRALAWQESIGAKGVAKHPESSVSEQRKYSLPSTSVPSCPDPRDRNEASLGPTLIFSCSTYSWQWSCSLQFDRLLPAHHLVINICSIWLYPWLNKFSYEKMQLMLKGMLILTVHFLL